jgi:hypothetical protein
LLSDDTILGRIPFFNIENKVYQIVQFFKSFSIETYLQELDQERKVEVVRESFLDTILNDITDIAILQEVIQRSQVGWPVAIGQWSPKKMPREN